MQRAAGGGEGKILPSPPHPWAHCYEEMGFPPCRASEGHYLFSQQALVSQGNGLYLKGLGLSQPPTTI